MKKPRLIISLDKDGFQYFLKFEFKKKIFHARISREEFKELLPLTKFQHTWKSDFNILEPAVFAAFWFKPYR